MASRRANKRDQRQADDLAFVRERERKAGEYDEVPDDLDCLVELIENPTARGIIDDIERRYRRADAGRRPHYPLFVMFLLQLLGDEVATKVRNSKEFRKYWPALRPMLAARYPGYPGLARGGVAPNWKHLTRYLRRHGLTHTQFSEILRTIAHAYADETGRGVGAFGGSRTTPHRADIVAGDGTGLRPLFDAVPGTEKWHPRTGEKVQARCDPNVKTKTVDGRRFVDTTEFVSLVSILDDANSMLIYDVDYNPVGKGNGGEAALGVAMLERLMQERPKLRAVAWDKVMRGIHNDAIYKMGLLPIVRGHGEGNDDRVTPLGVYVARCLDGTKREITLHAFHHDLVYRAIDATGDYGNVVVATREIKRKARNADGTYSWYRIGTLPDHPLVPRALRGAQVRVRLDNTEDDIKAGRNRAEHLRGHGPETDEFQNLYGVREITEAWHSWYKRNLRHGRARSVGALMQHFDMACAALHRNIITVLMHRRRKQRASGEPPPLPLAA
jgi:hypothetical protein